MDSRRATLYFITQLKSHPCLWQVKCDDYHNKPMLAMKSAAMQSLVEEMRQFDEDVTVEDLKKR